MQTFAGNDPLVFTEEILKTLFDLGLNEAFGQQGRTVTFIASLMDQDNLEVAPAYCKAITCPHCPRVILQALIELAKISNLKSDQLTAEQQQTVTGANIWLAHNLACFRENLYNLIEAYGSNAKLIIADNLKYVGQMGG